MQESITYPLLQDEALTQLVTQHLRANPRQFPLLRLLDPARPFNTDTLTWDILKGSRSMAQVTLENAQSPMAPREVVAQGTATPAVIKEKDFLDSETLSLLRSPAIDDADVRKAANARIVRALGRLNSRRLYRKHWLAAQALQGSISYTNGETGITFTISYGLNSLTAPSTAWSSSSASVARDIPALIEEFMETSDVPPSIAICNRSTMGAIAANDGVAGILDSPARREQLVAGYLPDFNGLHWMVVDGSYVDDSGAGAKWLPDGVIVLYAPGTEAEPTMQWATVRTPENDFRGGFRARTWETVDPQIRWLAVYENLIPIFYHPDRVQSVDVF